ncbi:MAG: GFA family protein [Pseudomonadota bacterium]
MSTRLSCHCGAIELVIAQHPPLETARRCDCSFCKRRQAPTIGVHAADLTITKGAEHLATYSWGTGKAEHHFCKICGIYTHHRRRLPDGNGDFGINIACLDGVDPKTLEPFDYFEGQAITPNT